MKKHKLAFLEKNLIVELGASYEFNIKNVIKLCLSYIWDFFYKIVLWFSGSNKLKNRYKKYYISIGAIFKDETPFLIEWIEYHKMLGVDHFYLYNNFSTDNYKEVLSPYIALGLVTLKEWPYECGQISAYEDCYKCCKDDTYWLTFIDIDEFFCPYYADDLKQWIKQFEKYPSVLVYWKMFGSSGLLSHNHNKFLIEQYVNSWSKHYSVGKHLMNTAFIPNKIYHHYLFSLVSFCGIKVKIPSVNEFGYFITYPNLHRTKASYSIQLNHYWSKSYDEYLKKKRKGDVFFPKEVQTRTFEIFMNFEKYNLSVDYKIWRYMMRLKLIMQNKRVEDEL